MDIRIFPPEEIIEAAIEMPLSKSVSNRALIINAMSDAPVELTAAACDDSRVMEAALSGTASGADTADIEGAGTAMRFLTAYFASKPGTAVTLTGNGRMCQRPIGVLVDALRSLGADISYAGCEGYPPLMIAGRRLAGGSVCLNGEVSSQYVSALMLAAPAMDNGLEITIDGDAVSMPYVDLTASMMRDCGIEVARGGNKIRIEPGKYDASGLHGDGDWSAASYWYEIAALSAGWIDLKGLSEDSAQGDRAVGKLFERLCISTEWEDGVAHLSPMPDQAPRLSLDMTDTPDLVPTVAVTCCMLNIPFRLSGLQTLRIKETDRLEALRTELLKLSAVTEIERGDPLVWEGARCPVHELPSIDTYGDHRMAMAFAPAAVFIPGIEIKDAKVVTKSYPGFWKDMASAGFHIVDSEKYEQMKSELE